MAAAGLGWLTMSLSNLLAPAIGRELLPFLMLPGVLGELSLTFWLLGAGVNANRWFQQATAPAHS